MCLAYAKLDACARVHGSNDMFASFSTCVCIYPRPLARTRTQVSAMTAQNVTTFNFCQHVRTLSPPCSSPAYSRANIAVTGAGPRIDGYMFMTDRIGLRILQRNGVFNRWEDKWATVSMTVKIRERGRERCKGRGWCCIHA